MHARVPDLGRYLVRFDRQIRAETGIYVPANSRDRSLMGEIREGSILVIHEWPEWGPYRLRFPTRYKVNQMTTLYLKFSNVC